MTRAEPGDEPIPAPALADDTAPLERGMAPDTTGAGRRAHPVSRRERVALLVVLAIAAGLRGAWIAFAADLEPLPFVGGDPWAYLRHGEELARGRGYHNLFTGVPTAFYPPGWPFLLAGVFFVAFHTPITDDPETLAPVVNLVLGTASVALVWWIGRRVAGAAVGLLAAAMLACWPNLVMLAASASIETVFAFFALAAVALLLAMPWAGRIVTVRSIAAGLVVGMLLLVRPMGLPVVVGLLVALLVAGRGWRDALARTGVVAGIAVIVLAPTLVRNWSVVGAPVLSTNVGDTLCLGYFDGASGGFDASSPSCAAEGPGPKRPEDELARSGRLTGDAVSFVVDDPVQVLGLVPKRVAAAFARDHDALPGLEGGAQERLVRGDARRLLVRSADRYYRIVGVLALAGLWWWVRDVRPERLLVVVSGVGIAATPVYLYGDHRFVVPAFPFVALFAASAVVAAARAFGGVARGRRTSPETVFAAR